MTRWFLLLLLAVAARPATAPRAGYSDTIAKSGEFVRQFMKQQRLQGVSVALLDREEVVWEQGFGWADRDKAIPMTPETVFHVGSVSKMFATTAILILVDDGKVALDAPVVRYLPDFRLRSSGYDRITVLRPGTLEEAGIETAGTLVLSADIEDAAEIIRQARLLNPELRVLVRCAHLRDAANLQRAGADVVAAGEAEVGVALAEAVTADEVKDTDKAIEQRDAIRRRLYGTSIPE